MELLEITYSINFNTIIAIVLAVATLFGAPYIVRQQNKKVIDEKVDKTEFKTEFENVKNEMKDKATYKYVDCQLKEVKDNQRDDKIELNNRLDRMEVKQDKILDYIIELSKK